MHKTGYTTKVRPLWLYVQMAGLDSTAATSGFLLKHIGEGEGSGVRVAWGFGGFLNQSGRGDLGGGGGPWSGWGLVPVGDWPLGVVTHPQWCITSSTQCHCFNWKFTSAGPLHSVTLTGCKHPWYANKFISNERSNGQTIIKTNAFKVDNCYTAWAEVRYLTVHFKVSI